MHRFRGDVIQKFRKGGEFEQENIFVVDTEKDCRRVLARLWQQAEDKKPVAVDSEYDAHAPKDENPIQCFSLSCGPDHKVVIPSACLDEFKEWLESATPKIWQNFMADEEVFEAAGIVVGKNAPAWYRGMYTDTFIADFLVDETDKRHDLKYASQKWLKKKMIGKFTDVFSYVPEGKKKKVMLKWPEIWANQQEVLVMYAADDPEKTYRLYLHHKKILKQRGYWDIYRREDAPFTNALINVSKRGMLIDTAKLQDILLNVTLGLLRSTHVFKALSHQPEINVRSPVQLKKLFFDGLSMPPLKQTKTEKDKAAETATCCDGDVLDRWSDMASKYPLGAKLSEILLEIRSMNTLRGTFLEGILNGLEDDGRLYSSLNQVGATTGRISSRKYFEEVEETYYTPKANLERTRVRKIKRGANLQNIPARPEKDPYGIRRAFVAAPGKMLVVVDKAGFEWWLMTHWSRDPLMLKQNQQDYDPHGQSATRFFNLPCKLNDWKKSGPKYKELKEKYKSQRTLGKTANFGFLYGCRDVKAAKLMGCADPREGQQFLDQFFELYSGIVDYHYRMINMARQKGYVETISGRRVHMPEIESDNNGVKYHEENRARNAPIQGSAAEIMKSIMNFVEFGMPYYKRFPADGDQQKVLRVREAAERCDFIREELNARMLIQVHDEIVWEVPEENAEEAKNNCIFIMENDRYQPLTDVLMPAEGKVAKNWLEAKG